MTYKWRKHKSDTPFFDLRDEDDALEASVYYYAKRWRVVLYGRDDSTTYFANDEEEAKALALALVGLVPLTH